MPRAVFDKWGREIPDPTPMSLPVGFKIPETLDEQIQRLVRNQVSRNADEKGFETFDEAEDFDVDDEIDPNSPFEMEFDPVLGRDVSADMVRADPERFKADYIKAAAESEEADEAINKKFRWPHRKKPKIKKADPEPAPTPPDPVRST